MSTRADNRTHRRKDGIMFHFFGRMRGNGRKAAPDYRLLDYADHLRFIRPFVQARYGSEPAQEILSILKDSADDGMDVFAIEKGASAVDGTRRRGIPRPGRADGVRGHRRRQLRHRRRERMRDADGTASPGVRTGRDGLDEPFTLPGGIGACSGDVWLPIDPMVPECLSEESACTVVELFEMPE